MAMHYYMKQFISVYDVTLFICSCSKKIGRILDIVSWKEGKVDFFIKSDTWNSFAALIIEDYT
jgi:hypothetical protein